MIRLAREEDCERIGELWLLLAEYHQQLDPAMPRPAVDGAQRYAQRIRSSLDDSLTNVFVAEYDAQIVGYVLCMIVDWLPEMFEFEMGGMLADIYVLPEFRARGIGQALVNVARDWFAGRGIRQFEWYVATANRSGVAFWRAMGGHEVMLRMRADTTIEREALE